MSITVMQVFALLGVEPRPIDSWSIGSRVATMWAQEHGEQPPKDNRPKTSGAGSHCFAIYPDHWQPRIADLIRRMVAAERSQNDLFPTDIESPKEAP